MIKNIKINSKSKKNKHPISFDEAVLVDSLLGTVPQRTREVLSRRFWLDARTKSETLESIGSSMNITRERVRQIEHAGIEIIRESNIFARAKSSFEELRMCVLKEGGIMREDHLLAILSDTQKGRNNFRFLLVVGGAFFRERESDDFYARWHVDERTAKAVHNALAGLYESLPAEEVLSEHDILNRFLKELTNVNDAYRDEEILKRWISMSKRISKNPLNEWARATSSLIRVKGIRDYAYMVVKRANKPMHFSEVTSEIVRLFSKKAHVATTHNELIKDKRFVLVGRGLYALAEWGYRPGVVRDVIADILKKEGPLNKEEILKQVQKMRFVKTNTVIVNLSDNRFFTCGKDGLYNLVQK
ncbi:MAG TPA: hypothetical protein ENI56_03080 [Candidatus Kaiserbacteria bacterium]|nr:hypothetical protein [Candidatus Kaiserbacteria bacterium]